MSSNENVDLILGDYRTAIRRLAWPMMLSMFLIMTYNLVDSIWVSGLGPKSLSAIGFITPIFSIIVGLGNGLGAGANSLIARCIGAGDKGGADSAAVHGIVLTVVISLLVSLVLFLSLPFLLDLMSAGDVKGEALVYGNIVFCFILFFTFSSVGPAILRSEGDVKRAMYAMVVTSVLNMVLDPIFIFVFGWGIGGAAWATVFSAFVTCLILVFWLYFEGGTFLDLSFSNFVFDWSVVFDELFVALPSSAEAFVFSLTAFIVNNFFVLVAGTIAVGVYTACMRLVQLAMIPLMGLGTAVLTVCGASFGAGDFGRIDGALSYSLRLGAVVSIVLMIFIFVFAPQLALIFTYSDGMGFLVSKVSGFLRILVFVIITVNFGLLPASMFQGVGRGFVSLFLSTFRTLIAESVFSYLFGIVFGWGEVGVYYGLVFGACCGAVLSFIFAKWYIRFLYGSRVFD